MKQRPFPNIHKEKTHTRSFFFSAAFGDRMAPQNKKGVFLKKRVHTSKQKQKKTKTMMVVQSEPEKWQIQKDLFAQGMQFAQSRLGVFFDKNAALNQLQQTNVDAANTFGSLCQAIMMYNFTREFGYTSAVVYNKQQQSLLTNVSFAVGHSPFTTWMISGGNALQHFYFTLSCSSIAPASVAKTLLGDDMSQNALWFVSGGFGTKGNWVPIAGQWLENVTYDVFKQNLFLLRSSAPGFELRVGTPEIGKFQINLAIGTHTLSAVLTSRSNPHLVNDKKFVNWHVQSSFVFSDMALELRVDQQVPLSGLGFAQRTELLSPPSAFANQFAFVRANLRQPLKRVAQCFVQFASKQYLFVFALPSSIHVGTYVDKVSEMYCFAYGSMIPIKKFQLNVTHVAHAYNADWPNGLELMFNNDALVAAPLTNAAFVSMNPSSQIDYQCIMETTATDGERGIAVLKISNVLPLQAWCDVNLKPAFCSLFVNQPLLRHRGLVGLLSGLPYFLLVAVLCTGVVLLCVFTRRRKRSLLRHG
jgi:hypothetical protein